MDKYISRFPLLQRTYLFKTWGIIIITYYNAREWYQVLTSAIHLSENHPANDCIYYTTSLTSKTYGKVRSDMLVENQCAREIKRQINTYER